MAHSARAARQERGRYQQWERVVEYGGFREVSLFFRAGADDAQLVEYEIAREIADRGLLVRRIVVFGHGCEPSFQLLGAEWPVAVVLNDRPDEGRSFDVEVCAVLPASDSVIEYDLIYTSAGNVCGSILRTRDLTYLALTNFGPAAPSCSAEADQAFAALESLLDSYGLDPRDIVRTWFFIPGIAENYRNLNIARDRFFDRWRLHAVPASTGVGARLAGSRNLLCLADAVRTGKPSGEFPRITTALQLDPELYGIRFIRGRGWDTAGVRSVLISGTSSIDHEGRSITEPLSVAVAHTVRSVEALLESAGLTLDDAVSCYLYCRDETVEEEFLKYLAFRGRRIDYLLHRAAICRPELEIEIELRAARRLKDIAWRKR